MLALPIFPVRLQTSIFGADELNFRVRDGNGWTLAAISTNLLSFEKESKQRKLQRTFLSLPSFSTVSYYIQFLTRCQGKNDGDPCGNRTHVCGVRGRRLSRLTNGPHMRVAYQSTPSKPNNERVEQAKPCINMLRSSPRRISTGQLHTLPCFHLRPINDVVHIVPYLI